MIFVPQVLAVKGPCRLHLLPGLLALALLSSSSGGADSPARECLEQAKLAAARIPLAGDRSTALRSISLALLSLDPQAARNLVAGMRRPSDAARSLAAVAEAVAEDSPADALRDAQAAETLLQRIPDPDQRAEEHRLLLRDIALLGEEVLATESGSSEPRDPAAILALLLARTETDPTDVLDRVEAGELQGAAADRALAAAALRLAGEDPDRAIEVVAGIASSALRDHTLWTIAQRRPAAEAISIAQQVSDPVARSSIQASAAVLLASEDRDAARAAASQVSVASNSAWAQLAAALAAVDLASGLEIARSLPARPRAWALGKIAVGLAATRPDEAERLLSEVGNDPEIARLAAGRMAGVDPHRAMQIAHAIPVEEERDAALAVVARRMASAEPEQASDLVWEIASPLWRARALEPAVMAAAGVDAEAATSLIGLVADTSLGRRLRAQAAAGIAVRDPATAVGLLESLPASDYRTESALRAGEALLAAGDAPETALRVAAVGLGRDLALRWMLPAVARSEVRSPIILSESIENPYARALGLVDVARQMLGLGSKPRAAPERARQVRPIVEWEGA